MTHQAHLISLKEIKEGSWVFPALEDQGPEIKTRTLRVRTPPKLDNDAKDVARQTPMDEFLQDRNGDARTPRDDFKSATLDDIVEAYTPVAPTEVIHRLREIVKKTQRLKLTPAEKTKFVKDVSRFMNSQNLRFMVDGSLGPIGMCNGSIQFVTTNGSAGFSRKFEIVRVPLDYGKKRSRANQVKFTPRAI